MPPGTVWRGRRYDEHTRIFADRSDQETESDLGYSGPMSTEFGRSLSREGLLTVEKRRE